MKYFFILLFFIPVFVKAQTWSTKTLSDSVRAISKRSMEQGKTIKVFQDSITALNKKVDSFKVSMNPLDFDITPIPNSKNRMISIKKKQ